MLLLKNSKEKIKKPLSLQEKLISHYFSLHTFQLYRDKKFHPKHIKFTLKISKLGWLMEFSKHAILILGFPQLARK